MDLLRLARDRTYVLLVDDREIPLPVLFTAYYEFDGKMLEIHWELEFAEGRVSIFSTDAIYNSDITGDATRTALKKLTSSKHATHLVLPVPERARRIALAETKSSQ